MAKGHQAHKERQEAIQGFGKEISKRAAFRCEWCEGREELRLWDYQPDKEPLAENLALLCRTCRELADGRKGDEHELRSIRNALWSNLPAVSEGAAVVLAGSRQPWVREAIEESLIDEQVKQTLLLRL